MRAPPVSEELTKKLRSAFYDRLGKPLIEDFPSVAKLETLVNQVGATDEEEESEEGAPREEGPARQEEEKLLDPKTWERDDRLVDTATRLRAEIRRRPFQDRDLFRDRVRRSSHQTGITLSATDLRLILRAVSWRVGPAPPVIAKIHKPGKAEADPFHRPLREFCLSQRRKGKGQGAKKTNSIVEYEPDTDLRDTEQFPSWRKAASRNSSAARFCPTPRTRGLTKPRPRSASRFPSRAISTNPSNYARSTKSAPVSWRWRRKPKVCLLRPERGPVVIEGLKPYPELKETAGKHGYNACRNIGRCCRIVHSSRKSKSADIPTRKCSQSQSPRALSARRLSLQTPQRKTAPIKTSPPTSSCNRMDSVSACARSISPEQRKERFGFGEIWIL